jgi:glutamate-ammonia-ligase adenylyltransferase
LPTAKLGGKELSYASDLDVIFLYDDDDQEAPGNYQTGATVYHMDDQPHTSGILFDIDVALRPDGASGLLVSSVASFERYQQQSAWLWEHQALTRARFCAGDSEIGARFEAIREQVLSTPRDEHHLRQEVLNMRQRMRDANPPHEGVFDLKHDAGGMIDVEFMVQYLVLRYAASVPALRRNTGNIALLRFAGEAGLIPADQAAACASAYRSMRKLQHRIRLQGTERARVAPELIAAEAEAAGGLWQTLFGNDQAVV